MDQNIKIVPEYQRTVLTPSILRPVDNALSVDYGGDMELIEVAEELNDAAKLKESATFDTDIPYNTRNRWIVENYGNSVPILLNAHGYQFPDREMQVNAYNETSAQYDVSFVRSQEWPEVLKNLSLNEVDGFSPFQLGETFIDDNQLNDAAYPGSDPTPTRGFYTPMAYYGGLNRFNEANSSFIHTYADYRVWFHYGKLLEQLFFAAGYKIDCPFLKTDFGQRMGGHFATDGQVYAGFASVSPSFKNKLQLPASKHYAFKAGLSAPQTITGASNPSWFDSERIQFDDTTTAPFFDNGTGAASGFFNTAIGAIQGYSGAWNYKIRLRITGGASPITAVVGIGVNALVGPPSQAPQTVFFDAGGNRIGVDLLSITVPGGSLTTTFNFYVRVESVLSNRDIGFGFFFGDGVGLTIEAGSYIEGTGEFIIVTTNPTLIVADTVNESIVFPQSWLSTTIKGVEVLESYCHRTNSKLYTDRARRIVGIYTEQDVPTYGQDTEPYYFKTIEQDMADLQVENSAQVSLKSVVAPAKYILGFKDPTDAYIDSVEKKNPFDSVIDMAPFAPKIDIAKTEQNRDNLTEPTLERPFVEIKSKIPTLVPISVMAILDNMVGEPSTKIAPRTAYFYGLCKQRKSAGSSVFKAYRKMEAGLPVDRTVFAYATQFPSGEIADSVGTAIDNDKTIVYDHIEPVTEPMKRYWIDKIRVLYTRQTRKLTIISPSFNRFLQMNLRSLYRFKFMGVDWKGRIVSKRTKINDFRKIEVEVVEDLV